MAHKTFKVCILIDNLVENFYIKHYIDEFQPVFSRFKNQVFQRNPNVNVPHLKIYWIDGENDEILIACEEDFRLFLEEGKGRKIFFSVNSANEEQNDFVHPMEAEEISPSKSDRKTRRGRDEEKERRHAKKLTEKLKYLEETCLKKEEKGRKYLEKREHKHVEKLEKAKRRVEQIRNLIGSIDPANLNSTNNSNNETQKTDNEYNIGASTSSESAVPSPETIRLLSNAIAGCLQPCSLINKILNEVIAMIPQMVEPMAPPPYAETQTNITMEQKTQATNTSNVGTPSIEVNQASHEIEALFKEAAKELEKMNEIVNNTKPMETSTTSSSGFTAITQIERVFQNINDSANSDVTVNMSKEQEPLIKGQSDETDDVNVTKSMMEDEFNVVTPPKSMRSRESSIEVHDINSVMSDDSRDWTILSVDHHDDLSIEPRIKNPTSGAIPKKLSVDNFSQVDLMSEKSTTETQTPLQLSLITDNGMQQELQASVQKSIDIVQKSIENIQKSIESKVAKEKMPNASEVKQNVTPVTTSPASIPIITEITQQVPTAPPQSQANLRAAGKQIEPKKKQFESAMVVFDPNPKINAAVHTMMSMGFTNEDNWLTQLMVNVEGDIPKALNFLTPQPKNVNKN